MRDLVRSNCAVTGLMTLLIGKGPMYLGPKFLDGCLDWRYLVDR